MLVTTVWRPIIKFHESFQALAVVTWHWLDIKGLFMRESRYEANGEKIAMQLFFGLLFSICRLCSSWSSYLNGLFALLKQPGNHQTYFLPLELSLWPSFRHIFSAVIDLNCKEDSAQNMLFFSCFLCIFLGYSICWFLSNYIYFRRKVGLQTTVENSLTSCNIFVLCRILG